MKLHTTEHVVTTEGLSSVTNFKIAVNGKAFRILLDGLYTNKIKAVVRELCTNAFDAMIAAGKREQPFTLKLPTVFDQTFSVRDYGVSMTHEQVFNLYSTLFESSKDDTNTQVGMLGLGSKSPFAYVDSFTVTAWLDGEKRIYSAFLGADGIPQIALLDTQASDEPQGIEVSLQAQMKDINAFVTNAVDVLKWFPVRPTIIGQNPSFLDTKPVLEGKGWKLIAAAAPYSYSSQVRATARQGCVAYPLDASAIPGLTEAHKALLQAALVIDFPIGSLDVGASREALSYDPETCENIVARLNAISKEIVDKHGTEIVNAATLWEAGQVYNKIKCSGLPSSIVTILGKTLWQGQTVTQAILPGTVKAAILKNLPDTQIEFHLIDHWRARRLSRLNFDHTSRRAADRTQVFPGDTTTFYVQIGEKPPSHLGMRVKEAQKGRDTNVMLIVVPDDTIAKTVIEAFGNPPVSYVHDLPKPVIQKAPSAVRLLGKTVKTQIKAKRLHTDGKIDTEALIDLSGDAYFIRTQDGKVVKANGLPGDKVTEYTIANALSAAADLKLFDPSLPIYLVNPVYAPRVADCPTWIDLVALVYSKLPETIPAMQKEFLEQERRHLIGSNTWTTITSQPSITADLRKRQEGALYEYLVALDDVKHMGSGSNSLKAQSNVRNLFAFTGDVSDTVGKAEAQAKAEPLLHALSKATERLAYAYPLAHRIPYYDVGRDAAKIIDYIEAMDLLSAKRAAQQAQAAQQSARYALAAE